MSIEQFKALFTILQYCMEQSSCKTCQYKSYCTKQPCEWDDLLEMTQLFTGKQKQSK